MRYLLVPFFTLLLLCGVVLSLAYSMLMGMYMPYINFLISLILMIGYIYSCVKNKIKSIWLIIFIFIILIWVPISYDEGIGIGYMYSKGLFGEIKKMWLYLVPVSVLTLLGLSAIHFCVAELKIILSEKL